MQPDDLSFGDRTDAGRQLAQHLMPYGEQHPVVSALPHGGVPVAFEVARALRVPPDLVFVRKIGASGHNPSQPRKTEHGPGEPSDPAKPRSPEEDQPGIVSPEPDYQPEGPKDPLPHIWPAEPETE